MAASLLRYWPGQTAITVTPVSIREEKVVSSGQSITDEHTRVSNVAAQRPRSSVSESSPSHEVYYDALSTPMIVSQKQVCAPDSSNSTTSKLGLTGSNDTEDFEWRKFQPPKELFDVPYGTPLEIESIVVASVERLQQQLAEEQSFHENVAFVLEPEQSRVEQDIPQIEVPTETESGKLLFSRTPRPYSSTTDATVNIAARDGPRLSDESITTTSSGDSGYVSELVDTELPKGRLSGLFHFGSPLRHFKDKPDTSKQTSLHSGSSIASTLECVSCLDDFRPKDLVPVACHSYCKPCFQNLINTALSSENHWPPKCCLNEIPTETVLPHLSPKDKKRYKEVLEERSVPAGERVYCSKPSCAAWIPPSNIQMAISCAACLSCRQKTCTSCRGLYHATGECPRDANLQATLQVANEEGWRRCYSCNALVEHNQGCIHMTCRCKAQFCYICGSRWRTCSCSDAELQRLLQAVNMRRLAAQGLEQEAENRRRADQAAIAAAEAEAAEMREILRQIEQFEMEEAERLAREEEEFRLAAIASRQRHEEERILAISKKYFDLRNELDFLHSIQRVTMTERYEEEHKELRQQEKMRKAMLLRHTMEIQLAEAVADAKISDSQFCFDQDYHSRLSKEREIEDKYAAELKKYWANRPGGADKIAEGREALRKAHEETYRRWNETKRAKHQQVVNAAKEEVARLRSRHEIERAVAAGKLDGRDEEMKASRKADTKWVERVTKVRVQMLEVMEMEEYALEA